MKNQNRNKNCIHTPADECAERVLQEFDVLEKAKYHVYDIGFNGDDETEFDVEPADDTMTEMAELMTLFVHFLQENNIQLKKVDYSEFKGVVYQEE